MVKISIVPRSLALTIGFHRMTQSDFNNLFLCGFVFKMGMVPGGLAPTIGFQRMTPIVTSKVVCCETLCEK